jgi:hypothetical protein
MEVTLNDSVGRVGKSYYRGKTSPGLPQYLRFLLIQPRSRLIPGLVLADTATLRLDGLLETANQDQIISATPDWEYSNDFAFLSKVME